MGARPVRGAGTAPASRRRRSRRRSGPGAGWPRGAVPAPGRCRGSPHHPYRRGERLATLSVPPHRVYDVDQLIIRGAREHNLKDVSLDLPRDALIVFTGLSGSGKSSLAFDTIFAEGQRRYVESLSAYARQFLGQMDKPDVDFIEGLSPGGLDRPEVHVEEPPLHRRHHHRGLRLPPPPLRPDRPPALPDLWRPDRAADPPADRRPRADPRGGPAVPGAGPGDPRPQGGVHRALPPAPGAGLLPGPGQRRDPTSSTPRRPSTSRRSTRSRSWSTGSRSSRRPSAGSPTRWRPRWASRAGWCCSTSSTSRRRTPPASSSSPRRWPAPTSTRSTPTSSSRGRSPSTPRSAPARSATASAPGWRSTPSWSSPTRRRRSARARSSRGARPTSPTTSSG